MTRMPIVAGSFYDAAPAACRHAVQQLIVQARAPQDLPANCVGGLVPHAGWVCSGAVAATTLKALTSNWQGKTIVLMGAVHSPSGAAGMLYDQGQWHTPLGDVRIDADLADAIHHACPNVQRDTDAHTREHSLEVQVPLIQMLAPHAEIVPLMVPPSPLAVEIGELVGRVLAEQNRQILVVGSTDLTHYGPRYGITPAGRGAAGLEWAERNDRNLLQLIEAMSADRIVEHTSRFHSACGGGAVAATIAACKVLGASAGSVLWYTNSYETLKPYHVGDNENVVGYASVVFA
jgi:MEMO1 family protein